MRSTACAAALVALAQLVASLGATPQQHDGVIRVRAHRLEQHRRQVRRANNDCADGGKSAGAGKRRNVDKNGQGSMTGKNGQGGSGTKSSAPAATKTLPPGKESLAAAIKVQLAGQDAGFANSSSALKAKFTAAADNNFGAKGSKKVSQKSLTLDKSQLNIASFSKGNPAAGQANSLTSTNNFINFCATQSMPLMNGLQQRQLSCNPIPMGIIVPVEKAPAVRWKFPVNGQTVAANKNITLQLNIKNLQTGVFTDAQGTYFAAPQTVNGQGIILGHVHFVVNQVKSCQDTTPATGRDFVFFKGIDAPAVNGVASFTIVNGLPAGSYRACSMTSSANHQPVLVSLAQRNNQDDCACWQTK